MVKVGDLEVLKYKLRLMLDNKNLAEKIAAKGRKKVEWFITSKVGRKYHQILENLMQKKLT